MRGINDETITAACLKMGSLNGIFDKSDEWLYEAGFNKHQINNIKRKVYDKKLFEEEQELIEKHNVRMICFEDEDYPEILKEIYNSPPYIYVAGDYENTIKKPAIGIVGSRRACRASREFTEKLAADLAEVGFNVVSGFAMGIDIKAHIGAVKKGSTTAVLGSGLLNIYPEQNKKYIKEVAEKGCFISEFPLRMQPLPTNFPRRNRIISGLSHGIVVVEAGPKSGSLITARMAVEQNREVFAVPSFPTSANRKCNDLIKDGAKLIEGYYDIVEEFSHLIESGKNVDISDTGIISFQCQKSERLYRLLEKDPLSEDELGSLTGQSFGELLATITELELDGLIFKDVDGRFRVTGGRNGQNCNSAESGN